MEFRGQRNYLMLKIPEFSKQFFDHQTSEMASCKFVDCFLFEMFRVRISTT
jgi:hypothetical protein